MLDLQVLSMVMRYYDNQEKFKMLKDLYKLKQKENYEQIKKATLE